jgi:hypothetical protein
LHIVTGAKEVHAEQAECQEAEEYTQEEREEAGTGHAKAAERQL